MVSFAEYSKSAKWMVNHLKVWTCTGPDWTAACPFTELGWGLNGKNRVFVPRNDNGGTVINIL